VLVSILREAERQELISDLEDRGSGSPRRTESWLNAAIWTTSHIRPPSRAIPAPPICAPWRMIHLCSGEWSHARTTDRMPPPVPIVSPAQVAPSGRRRWLWNRSTSLGHLFGVPLRAAHHPGVGVDDPPV
ncbi:MAG TPA: hypothetical protein VHM29_00730, partial [Acidimicrobiia bacterium]|nr:hypothetical protein [Acidimicrobiia bacterium]